MAVSFIGANTGNTGGAAAQTVAATVHASTAAGDTIYAFLTITGTASVLIMAPPGFGEIPYGTAAYVPTVSGGAVLRAYIKNAASGDAGATKTFLFESVQSAAVILATYRGGRNYGLSVHSGGAPGGGGPNYDYILSTADIGTVPGFRLVVLGINAGILTTQNVGTYTHRSSATDATAGGVSVILADIGSDTDPGTWTADVNGAYVDYGLAFYQDGILQPSGTAAEIRFYDTTKSPNSLGFDEKQFASGFPYDCRFAADNSDLVLSAVDIRQGFSGQSADTTFVGRDGGIAFKPGKRFITASNNLTSWNWNFGVKTGGGLNAAGGKPYMVWTEGVLAGLENYDGNIRMYGLAHCGGGGVFVRGNSTLVTKEVCGCYIVGSAANLGDTGAAGEITLASNNILISTVNIPTRINATDGDNNIIVLGSSQTDYIITTFSDLRFARFRFVGDSTTAPGSHCFRAGDRWMLTEPVYPSHLGGRISATLPQIPIWGNNVGVGFPNWIDAMQELWGINVLVTSPFTGDPVPGIPVWLDDGLGNRPVDTLTLADGTITFGTATFTHGSPKSPGYTIVAEEATLAGVLTTRTRGPWTLTVNSGPGKNPSYPTKTIKFHWPGTSTGIFRPLFIVVTLGPVGGAASDWDECLAGEA